MAKRRSRAPKSGRSIRKKRRWSLLVYIAGDNNLSDAGLKDIKEMCKAGSSSKLNAGLYVGVEIDTKGEHSGSIRYEITEPDYEGVAHRTVIDRLSEKDTGDPKVLKDFLKWGLKRYPADNCLLVVGGHGLGFRSPVRNIAYDDFGSSLDMSEMERALRRAGIDSANPLQILGFDACLMSMVEIAHHFASQTEIIVSSQHTEPEDGWPYREVLKRAKEAKTPKELAKGIVKDYKKDYEKRRIKNVTLSAVRTGDTQAVIRALHILGKVLCKKFDAFKDKFHAIRIETQTFYMADYIDLIHISEQIFKKIPDSSIKKAAGDVKEKAEKSIIINEKYPEKRGSVLKNANGLSVWFPATDRIYFKNRAKYMELHCNDSKFGWKSFLDRYHQ